MDIILLLVFCEFKKYVWLYRYRWHPFRLSLLYSFGESVHVIFTEFFLKPGEKNREKLVLPRNICTRGQFNKTSVVCSSLYGIVWLNVPTIPVSSNVKLLKGNTFTSLALISRSEDNFVAICFWLLCYVMLCRSTF